MIFEVNTIAAAGLVVSYITISYVLYTVNRDKGSNVYLENIRPFFLVFSFFLFSCGVSNISILLSNIIGERTLFTVANAISTSVSLFISMFCLSQKNKMMEGVTAVSTMLRRYDTVFEKAPVGIAIVSEKGRVVEVNSSAEEIFGYKASEMSLMHFKDFTHPDDAEKDLDLFRQLTSGKIKSYTMTKRYVQKDGSVVHGGLGVSLINDTSHEVVATISDLTQKVEYSKQIESQVSKLRELNEELNRFVYLSSHDLQEPLRTIKMFSGILAEELKGRLKISEIEYLDHLVSAATRMQNLIKDLLEYSRMSRKIEERRLISMRKIFFSAIEDLAGLVSESKASVSINMKDVKKRISEVKILSLVSNLLSNALKFAKEGVDPIIEIGSYFDEEISDDVFYVKDNGIGIEKEYQEKVFEVFARLYSQEEYSGTGIGLSICGKIVSSHGGEIWIESDFGFGTTVKFTIGTKPKEIYSGI